MPSFFPPCLLLLLLAACSAGVEPKDAQHSETQEAPMSQERDKLPLCASRADVERLSGKRVRVEGFYEVEPTPGGKRLQAATINLPDGTRLVRSYRPVPEELGFL